MKNKFKYQFDNITGIFYKTYIVEINIDDIKSSWKYAFEKKIIPSGTKGFILNYKKAKLKMNINEHLLIANFYKNNLAVFGGSKIAVITKRPKDIVIPFLVETKDDGYHSKPFSTISSAIEWVLK